MDKVSDKIGNMRIRSHADCSITIPRNNKTVEKYLDSKYERCKNQLKWYPQTVEGKDVFENKDKYQGHDGYIIGKGPSLDYLSVDVFKDPKSPVIALNEAIHVVEALDLSNDIYGMQQDAMLKQTCQPKNAPLMMPRTIQYFYPEMTNKYIYRLDQFTVGMQALSAQVALALLKMWGCGFVNMISFDACTSREITYAKSIGHPPEDDPKRFYDHCKRIANTVSELKMNIAHVTPEYLSKSVSDTPQHTSDNQPEHREHQNCPPQADSPDTSESSSETEQPPHETPSDHSESEKQS